MPLVSPSIYRLQEWGDPDRIQGRVIHSEEERAGKRAVGTKAQGGLAGKNAAAENDDAHRAPARVEADPRVPHQVLPGHFR